MASRTFTSNPEKLSPEGKALVKDAREVVNQAKNLFLSRNEGNLIQDFIWQTTNFDAQGVNTPNAPVSKDTAKRDGDEALQGLRTLGQLIITNGQFRKLLQDSTLLIRDMAGDAASNAASRVRPSDENLSQIDQPAEDNTWHDAPDFSKDNLKKQGQRFYSGNPAQDAKDVATAGANAAAPGNEQPGTAAQQGNLQQNVPQNASARDADPLAGRNAAKNVAEKKLDDHFDQETKDNVIQRKEEYRQKTKDYFNKKMPKERRDQTIWRLKKMILECQQHEDYSQAVQTILRLAETYGKHSQQVGQDSVGTTKDARGGLEKAEDDLRTIIERYANGTSTADLWDAINQIYRDADKDSELKNWFKAMDSYIRRCLLEQGYILDDASTREWDQLYDQGRFLLRDKYRGHTDRIVDEVKFLVDQFDQDTQNKAFADSLQKLFTDLGNDENGKPVFKPHLVRDLRDVILPAVFENIAYIPIPRIEYSDNQFDAIIENLVLESDNFAPNVFELANENYFRWGRKKIANKNSNTIEIKIAGVQMDLRDVSFHIKRKQGFPSITDTGVADVILPGDGFSFKMKLSTTDKKDRQNFFKVEKVDVDVKNLNFKIKESRHKLLFAIAKPIALKAMRPALQKAVEKAIKDQCNKFDRLLFQVKQEADRATAEAKSNPENAPNIYNRYYTAVQNQFTKGKKKAASATEDKKVNVAMTKEDSIFPNISLPGGISTKATEYRELARKGDKWESPVFSIGSAKKSTDIPAAPKIQRKSHAVSKPNDVLNHQYQNQAGNNYNQAGDFTQDGNNFNQSGNAYGGSYGTGNDLQMNGNGPNFGGNGSTNRKHLGGNALGGNPLGNPLGGQNFASSGQSYPTSGQNYALSGAGGQNFNAQNPLSAGQPLSTQPPTGQL